MRGWIAVLAGCALTLCSTLPLAGQEDTGRPLNGIHFTLDGLAFRNAADNPEGWRPGGAFAVRVPISGVFVGALSVGGVATRRLGGPLDPLNSRALQEYSGHTGIVTVSGGARIVTGRWATYTGVGLGRMWDSQPGGEVLYGGPVWVAEAELERRLDDLVGVHVGYKLLRMSMHSDHWLFQGDYQVHHQLAVGLTITPG